jgi:hypothetical protein
MKKHMLMLLLALGALSVGCGGDDSEDSLEARVEALCHDTCVREVETCGSDAWEDGVAGCENECNGGDEELECENLEEIVDHVEGCLEIECDATTDDGGSAYKQCAEEELPDCEMP